MDAVAMYSSRTALRLEHYLISDRDSCAPQPSNTCDCIKVIIVFTINFNRTPDISGQTSIN